MNRCFWTDTKYNDELHTSLLAVFVDLFTIWMPLKTLMKCVVSYEIEFILQTTLSTYSVQVASHTWFTEMVRDDYLWTLLFQLMRDISDERRDCLQWRFSTILAITNAQNSDIDVDLIVCFWAAKPSQTTTKINSHMFMVPWN